VADLSACLTIERSDLDALLADGYSEADLADAVDAYRRLHWGTDPTSAELVEYQPPGLALTALGELYAAAYDTTKTGDGPDGAVYFHEFEDPKPLLAVDPATGRLHIVGGGYTVETRGIVG
jgi:hypothetical protein